MFTISLSLIRIIFTFWWQVGSLQFRTTLFIHTVSSIPRDSSVALSSIFPLSMVFAHIRKARLPFVLFSETFLTIRQNSLNVAVCMIARTSYEVTLPTRLAPCITTTHRVWLHGSLAITATGLAPASVVQLRWTHHTKKRLKVDCNNTTLNRLLYSKNATIVYLFGLYIFISTKIRCIFSCTSQNIYRRSN